MLIQGTQKILKYKNMFWQNANNQALLLKVLILEKMALGVTSREQKSHDACCHPPHQTFLSTETSSTTIENKRGDWES